MSRKQPPEPSSDVGGDVAPRHDSIEWSRRRWVDAGEPAPDHFAAMAAVMRLHQVVGAGLDRALREHDLTRTAYLIMCTLRIACGHTLRMGQLSRRLMLHPTTISLVVDKLEKRGLVIREPHATDRRTVLATLTGKGVEALAEANRTVAESGYGLPEVSDRLAITLTEVVREVREKIGDR